MPDVFINYRTGDGEKTAIVIDLELSKRFDRERIFYASKSIRAGESYPDKLLQGVRKSSLLLAVLGPGWIEAPGLRVEDDWVRKEILTAFDCGVTVVPVLDGRRTERLRRTDLPVELERLADVQSVRLDLQHNARVGLAALGDLVAELVPELQAIDKDATRATEPSEAGSTHNSVSQVTGPTVQARDAGNVVQFTEGVRGAVHIGRATNNNDYSHRSSGDGANHVSGDQHGNVSHQFGGRSKREDDGR